MLHALAMLLPRPLRPLACVAIGHLWRLVGVTESPVPGFRPAQRSRVAVHVRCALCERATTRAAIAGPVR